MAPHPHFLKRRAAWGLTFLLLVALVVRLVAIHALAQPPVRDELDYHRLAVGLLAGGGYGLEPGRPTTFIPPLYPAFLAAVYLVFGEDYRAAWYAQALLNAASLVLVYLLGTALFSARVGVAAAGLFALYPSFEIVTTLHRENLAIPLLLGFLCALVKGIRESRGGLFLLAGVASGLLSLTSPIFVFLPLAVLGLGLLDRRVRPHWRRLFGLALVALVLWAPWQLRNSRLPAEPTDAKAYAYVALVFGHYPVFSGSFWWPLSDMGALERERERARQFLKERELALGGLPPDDRLARAWGELMGRIRDRPLAYAGFVLNRDLIFLASPPPGSSILRRRSPLLAGLAFVANALFVGLASLILVRTYRKDASAFGFIAALAYLLVVHGLTHSIRRYGYVFGPAWVLFGVAGLAHVGSRVGGYRGRLRDPLKRVWYSVFPRSPYAYLGRAVIRLVPGSYVSKVRDNFFTGRGPSGIVGDAIRAELNRRYYSSSESDIRRRGRAEFWGSDPGKRWHDLMRERCADPGRFSTEFLEPRLPLVFDISDLLGTDPRYHTVCEIGTGNGIFLRYLASRFPMVHRFVGVDLNGEQIRENQETYKGTGLEFVHGEISDWIETQGKRGTIFVACETFEFFTYNELRELLGHIRAKVSPAAVGVFALVSPRLSPDTVSLPRGSAAYSHNYLSLFRECGYDIFRHRVVSGGKTGSPYDIFTGVALTRP